MSEIEQAKDAIRNIHKIWYGDTMETNKQEFFICMHHNLETLFNFAGIEETLAENNPDGVTLSQLGVYQKGCDHA